MQAQISKKTKKQEIESKKERDEKKALRKAQKSEMKVIRLHQGKYKELNPNKNRHNESSHMSTCPEIQEATTSTQQDEDFSKVSGRVSPSAFKEVKNYDHQEDMIAAYMIKS